MPALFFRLALLIAGMGITEITLGDALIRGSLVSWAVLLLVGLPLIVAGSASVMVPLFGARERVETDA